MPLSLPPIVYCGEIADPARWWLVWNDAAPIWAALLAWAALTARHAPRSRPAWAAWALALLLYLSPLCALSATLFSVRVLHHLLLVGAVAPLLALAAGPAARPFAGRGGAGVRAGAVAVARAAGLCLGPDLGGRLLADAGVAAGHGLVVLARRAAARPALGRRGAGAVRHRGAHGPAGRADRVRRPAAVPGARGRHAGLGRGAAGRPAAGRAADVGAGHRALHGGGAVAAGAA